jgi:hypothetical protein
MGSGGKVVERFYEEIKLKTDCGAIVSGQKYVC